MEKIFKYPLLNIIVILGITVFFSLWLPQGRIDNDVTSTLPPKHPSNVAHDQMKEDFGGTGIFVIGIKSKNGKIITN
ncbi:MAG: hypothetical protein MJB14_08345, partial [Spirochaetes bacterium]|nr:hypothetical protein [Spirochaetota bacterium]